MKRHPESRGETFVLRGLRYHVRHWGADDAPPLFLLHGWMDSSPTFQFLVEALQQEWHLIAPDWRGYGQSEWLGRPYWFPDYYGDLDALLARYSPEHPARLVGHSMGANIAAIYASARPQRVSQVAMLDFLGLMATDAKDAPGQLAQWLDHLGDMPRLSTYADHAALQRRMQQANPRLDHEKAAFLARALSCVLADGRVQMACDPWHRVPAPILYRIDDQLACWQAIEAPVLMLLADDGFVHERFGNDPTELKRRLAAFRRMQQETIADCGHNLHHDQPAQVAAALEGFLTRG
ncbi:MAG: alpha/beta hydrolase [Rhodocyclales bacterium]|nr:alpha/beta hydrolase [Rhodocyclales bacterium]